MSKQRKMNRVAIYARYSSDNQRDESIDAQLRAAEKYCRDKEYIIVEKYLDRAKSGRTDKRPEFQRMMDDSKKDMFDIVLVHKLNRFSRNLKDAFRYKTDLSQYGIRIESISEHIDGTPMGIIVEAVLFGVAESFSADLALETMKGMRENAYKAKHTGGKPPLGFDVDKTTKQLIINKDEAPIVQMIFKLYDEGVSYNRIIDALNALSYTTKAGKPFAKNSLNSILRNEKYSGMYFFNKRASQDAYGKRNNHSYKSDDEIIRIDGGCPAIISKDLWNRVQAKIHSGVRVGGRSAAKNMYLLTGVVYCGCCGRRMTGNRVISGGASRSDYQSYRCENRECNNGSTKCLWIDAFVLSELERIIFNEQQIPFLLQKMREFQKDFAVETVDYSKEIAKQIKSVDTKVNNIINAIANGISDEHFSSKLDQLREEREMLLSQLQANEHVASPIASRDNINEETIHSLFAKYKQFIQTKNMFECRKFISTYVRRVTIHPDNIDVELTVPSIFAGEHPQLKMNTSINLGVLKKPFKQRRTLKNSGKLIPLDSITEVLKKDNSMAVKA